jgi:hypothetical protein
MYIEVTVTIATGAGFPNERGKPGDCHFFASSRTEVYVLSLMLLVEISNTHVLEVSMQLVPFVTMK